VKLVAFATPAAPVRLGALLDIPVPRVLREAERIERQRERRDEASDRTTG
jgi:hypothetical protein